MAAIWVWFAVRHVAAFNPTVYLYDNYPGGIGHDMMWS